MNHPRISFHGAAGAVTGSCFRLETEEGQLLIDCGLFQGSKSEKELNYRAFPFPPDKISAVILSHAHIDHSGLLPKLVREGFNGQVHCTAATADLAEVMLPDSAHIQAVEVEQRNRRSARRNRAAVSPIYNGEDVEKCLALFQRHSYMAWFAVVPGIRARLWNAGHMLGSSSVEVEIVRPSLDRPLRLLFSADIGPDYKLLHRDPEGPADVDYVVCESTYGDVERRPTDVEQRRAILRDEVLAAMKPGGALIVPSFAVERAQELIADLTHLIATKALPGIPVYLDSPLAQRATTVFAKHWQGLEGGAEFVRGLKSTEIQFTESVEQSKALDRLRAFHIVIAASGMCEAGRIRHRLKNWVWRDEATVLLVGFQAEGTLGRILQDGAKAVRIQGEEFDVRARIRSIDLYSGHADGAQIVSWLQARLPIRRGLFLVHGEELAIAGLVNLVKPVLGTDMVIAPALDDCFELTDSGARRLSGGHAPRLPIEQVAHLDSHNKASELFLDINDALASLPDEKARGVLIRKLRRALADTGPQ